MYVRYAIKNNDKKLKKPEDIEVIECNDLYFGYKNNEHHWTTDFVWNTFIPKLFNDLEIKLNKNDFKKIENFALDCNNKIDLSYHVPINDNEIIYNDLLNNTSSKMKISDLRAKHNENLQCEGTILSTDYHRLFRGCHRVCEVINEEAKTNRILIFNCDSMSIPVIPILCVYYKQILILDNRTRKSFKNKIKTYFTENTDIIEMFIVHNWNANKIAWNIK